MFDLFESEYEAKICNTTLDLGLRVCIKNILLLKYNVKIETYFVIIVKKLLPVIVIVNQIYSLQILYNKR